MEYVMRWKINTHEIINKLKTGKFKSAKDISWYLLEHKDSLETMEETEHGDSAENNFALNVFENALDWRLGLAIVTFIQATLKKFKGIVKTFYLSVDRKGDIYITYPSSQKTFKWG